MKIKKADYLTMEYVAKRLGCEPDALKIIEAIERLKSRIKRLKAKARRSR